MRHRLKASRNAEVAGPGGMAGLAPTRAVTLGAVVHRRRRHESSECGKHRWCMAKLAGHACATSQACRIGDMVARLGYRRHPGKHLTVVA